MIILGILGILFNNSHPELVGGEDDPENGPEVAATVFTALVIYTVRSAPTASQIIAARTPYAMQGVVADIVM